MNPTKALRQTGQSIWLDNIRRSILDDGTLERYVQELGVTGLTSNPTIFKNAITGSADYDESIRAAAARGGNTSEVFFEVAIEDLQRAADIFRPIWEATQGLDGYVSLEVSPRLADDEAGTIAEAVKLHEAAGRENLCIKVPGTEAGARAIEELIFRGIPINVTLLFSVEHWQRSAEAYVRGLERRAAAGLSLDVASVASLFISRWDGATADQLPGELRHRVGIAIGETCFRAYQRFFAGERWEALESQGARVQRLLWASTGTKDPALPAGYYLTALAAADTVNTVPEATLLAFAESGEVRGSLGIEAREADERLAAVQDAGISLEALARELQDKGRDSFVVSFDELLEAIQGKLGALT